MSDSQEHLRKAEELERGVQEAVRVRQESRDGERERLERMHAEESGEDGQLLTKVRTLRMVEQFYALGGPEQHLRLSQRLYRFVHVLVLLPAALGVLVLHEVGAVSGAGGLLVGATVLSWAVVALGLLLWHHRRSWQRSRPGWVVEACCWSVCLVPVLAAGLAWSVVGGEWVLYAAITAAAGALTARASVFAARMRRLSHQALRERDQR